MPTFNFDSSTYAFSPTTYITVDNSVRWTLPEIKYLFVGEKADEYILNDITSSRLDSEILIIETNKDIRKITEWKQEHPKGKIVKVM